MATHPEPFTGQPSPGASVPIPVDVARSLDDIRRDQAERGPVARAIRDTLGTYLASHRDHEHRTVEVLPPVHPDWRWIDLTIDGRRFSLSVMELRP